MPTTAHVCFIPSAPVEREPCRGGTCCPCSSGCSCLWSATCENWWNCLEDRCHFLQRRERWRWCSSAPTAAGCHWFHRPRNAEDTKLEREKSKFHPKLLFVSFYNSFSNQTFNRFRLSKLLIELLITYQLSLHKHWNITNLLSFLWRVLNYLLKK